eukprot:193096-Alexandrium_andersonii.AAC.1
MDDVEYWIVHVITPNFKREEHDSRVPALTVLVRAYLNVLRQFAKVVEGGEGKTLRLPPLAAGLNAGKTL